MTPTRHPDDAWLLSYAAGSLDLGQHIAVATHLRGCPRCRAWTRTMERMGGAMLSDARPAELSEGALDRALARVEDPTSGETAATLDAGLEDRPPQLPSFVQSYPFGPWRKLGSVVRTREILLPEPSATRVLLLESNPGAKVFAHTHGPLEMTCVLTGAFRHRGGRFGPGDFDLAEREVHHAPEIEDGEACLCLVAMQGELRWQGLIGRLLQPFIRL